MFHANFGTIAPEVLVSPGIFGELSCEALSYEGGGTVLYCAVQCCAVLCCTVLYCTVLCCAVVCCSVLYCAVLYRTIRYRTVRNCAVVKHE